MSNGPDMTVFYAWQSDLDNSANRGLTQKALETAVRRLSVNLEVRMDQGTQGVPGSPQIAEMIFRKISEAVAFVPDMTFVTRPPSRLSPNPNVLIEYGYALAKLGDEAILPVFNEESGDSQELPFDIRHKRKPLLFSAKSGPQHQKPRQASKEQLAKDLEASLRLIVDQL